MEKLVNFPGLVQGTLNVSPSGNLERKMIVQKVQYSNAFLSSQSCQQVCALVTEVKSLSHQPEMSKMEEM